MNRVVVTGLGIVSPLGRGVDENWGNLVGAGPRARPQSGADLVDAHPIPSDPISSHSHFGQAQGPAPTLPTGFSRARELSISAVGEALSDAGLTETDKMGCTFSASKPLSDNNSGWIAPDAINDEVCRAFQIRGETRNVIAACATGAYSIAMGASWIEQGLCDVVLAGSVEPDPHPLIEAGFRKMGVVSPGPVMRPFDRRRSGFLFGEGAGAILLESETHAARRGKTPYVRLSGWGLGCDAHSPVAFNSNGARIADVIRKAMARASLPPTAIGHVNAHGTATRLNDWLETQAILQAFGNHARELRISATKSSTGHLLGAAGSVEFILTVLALVNQTVPPTRYLEEPDPECTLNYTAGTAQRATFDHALSLSFGFGGSIGALAVSRC